MKLVLRKSLSNGATSITAAESWDVLKYKMTQIDEFGTPDWDNHGFSWESLHEGYIINDGVALWRYFDIEFDELVDVEIFEGRVIFLIEIND